MIGKIIDCEIKGNVVKFYLGYTDGDYGWLNKEVYEKYKETYTIDQLDQAADTYYGDDWNDIPYEHNCGKVYDEYIKGARVNYFQFDDLVLEPCNGTENSNYCRNDFKKVKGKKQIPCLIVIPSRVVKLVDKPWEDSFEFWNNYDGEGSEDIEKYYFEEVMQSGSYFYTGEHQGIMIPDNIFESNV